jgi:hypothetical protein
MDTDALEVRLGERRQDGWREMFCDDGASGTKGFRPHGSPRLPHHSQAKQNLACA